MQESNWYIKLIFPRHLILNMLRIRHYKNSCYVFIYLGFTVYTYLACLFMQYTTEPIGQHTLPYGRSAVEIEKLRLGKMSTFTIFVNQPIKMAALWRLKPPFLLTILALNCCSEKGHFLSFQISADFFRFAHFQIWWQSAFFFRAKLFNF